MDQSAAPTATQPPPFQSRHYCPSPRTRTRLAVGSAQDEAGVGTLAFRSRLLGKKGAHRMTQKKQRNVGKVIRYPVTDECHVTEHLAPDAGRTKGS